MQAVTMESYLTDGPLRKETAMSMAMESLLALGDRNRLLLMRLLLEQPFSVGDLVHVSGLGQSLVSHHLAVLARSGWVLSRKDGRRRLYSVRMEKPPLASLSRWIKQYVVLPEDWQVDELSVATQTESRGASSDMEDYLL